MNLSEAAMRKQSVSFLTGLSDSKKKSSYHCAKAKYLAFFLLCNSRFLLVS